MVSNKIDTLIIGAGPGGYPAAIRAAQLGKKVMLVDKGTIGGECLNWGCIPSKAMISAANFYHKLKTKSDVMGITADNVSVDLPTLKGWKVSVQTQLINGIKSLLKANKVELVIGEAKFLSKNQVSIKHDKGDDKVSFDSCIIATGASFISIPGFEIDEIDILSSKGLLDLEQLPEELICIGGGIIGLELGTVYAKLGTKVKVVELLPQLMTGVEKRLVNVVKKKLKSLGVELYMETKGTKVEKKDGKLHLEIDTKGNKEIITGDKILLSIGKTAGGLAEKVDLKKAGVKTDRRGFIEIDSKMQTNVSGIYAIGDCTGMPFLAHRATKQGIIAAEVIAGLKSEWDFVSVPGAIFTDPEIAFAGLSEKEAKDKGYEVIVGSASFAGSGRALSQLSSEGMVRVITDAKNDALLGIELVGPHASDLISEAALALEMGATAEDLGYTIHPHPTLPEMMMEAAEAIHQKAIHVPNTRIRKKK